MRKRLGFILVRLFVVVGLQSMRDEKIRWKGISGKGERINNVIAHVIMSVTSERKLDQIYNPSIVNIDRS